jgi:hypothetical protein
LLLPLQQLHARLADAFARLVLSPAPQGLLCGLANDKEGANTA